MGEISISTQVIKHRMSSNFFWKGIIIAVLSGMCYGLFSAFLTLGMDRGIWTDWYGDNTAGLSVFVITYVLASLGSAINDTCSAIWAGGIATAKGKIGDFFRCLTTSPGRMMILAALAGGPIASTAYVAGLQLAGSIIIPISALCPAIGAILSRFFFKQPLTPRMLCGIAICVAASFMIGSTGIGDDVPDGYLMGILIALIAALGWGLEGCVAGYGTSMIDYEIGITIRQTVSGLSNLFILLPIFCIISGKFSLSSELLYKAATDSAAMPFFVISAFFSLFAFSLWYKGNSMCGTALGMASNGMYSFWGPFFCWIIIGVFGKTDGWGLPPIAWFAAILMSFGILMIAVNPLDLFRKDEATKEIIASANAIKPLNFAILKHFTTVDEACAEDVIDALRAEYGEYKSLKREAVIEALMTAEKNGLLEEARYSEDENGYIRIYYHAHEDGLATINKYIKD